MPTYAQGTPCWFELDTTDGDSAARFYSELFGWSAEESGPPEETGGYRMFTQNGQTVAGLMAAENVPNAWMTFFSVDDADAVASRVTEHGGTVPMAPMDVMDIGRMAVFADTEGAAFGVWQPRAFSGAEITGKPGSNCWTELVTPDANNARTFYRDVFGWKAERSDLLPGQPYTIWQVGDRGVAGMFDHQDGDCQPHWGTTFAVEDVDTVMEKAKSLGGSVVEQAIDTAVGRYATLADPNGAAFQVIKPAPMPA